MKQITFTMTIFVLFASSNISLAQKNPLYDPNKRIIIQKPKKIKELPASTNPLYQPFTSNPLY